MTKIFGEHHKTLREAVLASIIGAGAGLLGAGLLAGIRGFARVLLYQPLGVEHDLQSPLPGLGRLALIVVLPTLAGLLVGLLIRQEPLVAGGGTEAILDAYERGKARLPGLLVPLKWLASILTVGSGGSGGAEGPVAMMGAAGGSWAAERLGLGLAERRVLLSAGIAGGVGAVFQAPLGAALFAAELHSAHPGIEGELIIPNLLAAVAGQAVCSALLGHESLLNIDAMYQATPTVLLGLTGLAVLGALWVRVMTRGIHAAQSRLQGFGVPWRSAVGGALVGVIGLSAALVDAHWLGNNSMGISVLGEGYPVIPVLAAGGIGLALLVLFGKLATTMLTIGSGGSGGIFAPTMVMGACLGALLSSALQAMGANIPSGVLIAGGMTAVFAAGTCCPLAAVLLVAEACHALSMLPALCWVAALAYGLGPKPGFFHNQTYDPKKAMTH